MTVVGTAEIVVRPNTAAFGAELKEQTTPAFVGMEKEAELSGTATGANLRDGVREHTGKLAGDLEADGRRGGEALSRGASGGLTKLGTLINGLGLPLDGLSKGLTKSGQAMALTDSRAAGLVGTLDHLGEVAFLGLGIAAAGVAAEGIHLATSMQTADATIASAAGTTVASATKIGEAFLGTAGKSEYSAQEMATAFSAVAGQLKTTEGHALSAAEAMEVMEASESLAVAKQIDLASATAAVSTTMQAFHLDAKDAAHASDVLFQTSNATGQSVSALSTKLGMMHSKMGDVAGSLTDMSALLIDMTNHGITGRPAMTGLTSGLNNLGKTSVAVTKATQDQDAALSAMAPSLRSLAEQYKSGGLSAKDFAKATTDLSPQQAALATQFTTATHAVATSKAAYASLGIDVFNTHGKFVGMASVIDQLHPKFAKMSQEQQLAAASTLFGAGAARQMTAIINAGPAAYDKAARAAGKLGAAHEAAAKQDKTLSRETQLTKSAIEDEVTVIGEKLVPVVLKMVTGFVTGTKYVLDHKAALIALGVVLGGPLAVAMTVFTVNKMFAFAQSFRTAQASIMGLVTRTPVAVASVESIGVATETTGGQMEMFGAAAMTASTEVEGAMVGTEAATVAAAGGIDIALGSTGVGAILIGLGLAATLLLTHWKQVWGEVRADAAATVHWLKAHWQLVGAILLLPLEPALLAYKLFGKQIRAAFGAAVDWIETAFDNVVGFIKAAPGKVASAASGMFDGMKNAFRSAINWIIKGWDSLHFTMHVPSVSFGPLGSIGGGSFTVGMPHIPMLAAGGIAMRPTLAGVGDGGEPEAVVPLSRFPAVAAAAGFTPRASAASSTDVGAQVFNYFVEHGLSKAQSAGIVGNLQQESSLNPASSGGYLAQWGGARLSGLQAYAAAQGKSVTNLGVQLDYMWKELTGTENRSLKALRQTTTSTGAAAAFSQAYERPGIPALSNRERYAQAALVRYGNSVPSQHTSSTAASGMTTTKLNNEITQQRAALAKKILLEQDAVKHGTDAQKQAVRVEVVQQKAALTIQIANEKGALQGQTKQQATELKKQTADQRTGASLLKSMLTAIHKGSLTALNSALWSAHQKGLSAIEKRLSHDHSTALAALAKKLIAVHEKAVKAQAAQQKIVDDKAAAEKAAADDRTRADRITASTQLANDQAGAQVRAIQDASRVTLDQMAEGGLSGLDLAAAQAQTALDRLIQGDDQTIAVAQQNVDYASSGTETQKAQAAADLASAQAATQIAEAQQQAAVDMAKATASASDAAASADAAVSSSTSTVGPSFQFTINGGGMTAADLMTEVGWLLKTGSLPPAAPMVVPPAPALSAA